jgi:hypothetical protein
MANPVWIEPKGMEIEKLTGMPGLVVKYNALVGNGAKPERLAGVDVPASAFKLREQYLADIEELMGTFDIIKGQKPTGVEAFSALQLLVERSQSRFSGVFQARGNAYKNWFKFALELEREFGAEEKTKATFTPARKWSFQTFQRSQLQGSVSIIVEDGSNVPKTALGMRAAVEHANTLGMLNMQDPDQQYEGLKLFGLTKMIPTLDIHIQAARSKQQAFEQWIGDPAAQQQSQGYKFLEAVRKSNGDEVVKMLDQPGQRIVNARDVTTGEGALHIVTKPGDATYLRFLLARGADPNMRDGRGDTPLLLAVQYGQHAIVDLLATA